MVIDYSTVIIPIQKTYRLSSIIYKGKSDKLTQTGFSKQLKPPGLEDTVLLLHIKCNLPIKLG